MSLDNDLDSSQLPVRMRAITDDILSLADSNKEDSLALLALLRALEQVHREIRENLFQASLPSNRQALHALLRDLEESGGWPYIARMKLRSLLSHLQDISVPPNPPRRDD
ncbi:MAG: hypothetical protein WA919_24505 [Coleofasciculaceae cyanobacterium]